MNEERRSRAAVLEFPATNNAKLLDGTSGKLVGRKGGRVVAEHRTSVTGNSQWGLIFAIMLVAINLRPGIVSLGPILPAIQREFGLSHAMASLLTAIPDLLMGLLAIPTPWLARRFGRNGVLLGALILLSAATIARGFVGTTEALLLATGGVGAGIAVAGALFGGLIKERFPKKVALLMGIYATALSLGSTVSAAATGVLAANLPGGWRSAAAIWGLLGVLAIYGWRVVAKSETSVLKLQPTSAASATRLPFSNAKAWLVALFFACDNFLFYALLSWIAAMYNEFGLPASEAGLILASFTAAFMCANPIIGALSKKHDRRGWLFVCACFIVAGLSGVAFSPMHMPVLWVALVAFGLGGGFTLGMTLPLDNTHGREEANSWNAFSMLIGYLIAAGGPFIVGLLRDWTGTFHIPAVGLVGVGLIMVMFVPFLKPRELPNLDI